MNQDFNHREIISSIKATKGMSKSRKGHIIRKINSKFKAFYKAMEGIERVKIKSVIGKPLTELLTEEGATYFKTGRLPYLQQISRGNRVALPKTK